MYRSKKIVFQTCFIVVEKEKMQNDTELLVVKKMKIKSNNTRDVKKENVKRGG